ncbi:hypothetical protein [Tumebacillus lipolyticus]|uniref:Phr family secreted Rap phosphatase inhibitor n=1 Tax=Tumebacillus lipolyticus TaxID=1280370 RepID=A0ABW4ZZ60_9BACL
MKKRFLTGLLLVALAIIAFGNTNVSQNAEISHPEPASIVIFK